MSKRAAPKESPRAHEEEEEQETPTSRAIRDVILSVLRQTHAEDEEPVSEEEAQHVPYDDPDSDENVMDVS